MCATFRKWNLVMYFLYLYKNSLLITEFTKWMGLNITVTDAFPRTTIPSPCVRISLVLLVTSVLFLLMFLRLCDIKKALIVVIATIKASADFSFSLFADYTISHRTPLHLVANHSNFQIYIIFWKIYSSDCFVVPSLNSGRIHIQHISYSWPRVIMDVTIFKNHLIFVLVHLADDLSYLLLYF